MKSIQEMLHHFEYQADESTMTSDQKALNELYYEIGRNDLEYADNLRVARVDSEWDMEKYNKQIESGCCGSFDTKVVVDGIEYAIGCNYGH